MRKITPLLLMASVSVTLPASASADRADCPKKLERSYSKHYRKVVKAHGTRAPGRNIRRYGVLFRGTKFDAVCSELRRSRRQLKRLMVSPPYSRSTAVPPPQPPSGVMSDATRASTDSVNLMVNTYCESSGKPQVVSANGLYWGLYQFDHQTWVAHGGAPGAYGNAPPWVQHQVAARVGYDAWPNC